MYSLYKTKKICMFAVTPPSLLYEVPNLNFFSRESAKNYGRPFFSRKALTLKRKRLQEKGAYFEVRSVMHLKFQNL